MKQFTANTWGSGLTVGGFTDSSRPTTLDQDGTCSGPPVLGYDCSGRGMGHLLYNQLGGTAGLPISSSEDLDLALFSNIQNANYWSDTASSFPFFRYDFDFFDGRQDRHIRTNVDFGWAVRIGDVASVPAPSAIEHSKNPRLAPLVALSD